MVYMVVSIGLYGGFNWGKGSASSVVILYIFEDGNVECAGI